MQKVIIILMLLIVNTCCNAAIIIGNPKGNVSLDFVYDYQCGYCHKMWQNIKRIENNTSNVKIRLHPLALMNQTSMVQAASLIYLANKKDDKFYTIHDYISSNNVIALQDFQEILGKYIKIDNIFLKAIHSKEVKEQMDEGLSILATHNIESIPFVVITGINNKAVTFSGMQDYKTLLSEVKNAS